jgi:malonate decarboxylase delta subunit
MRTMLALKFTHAAKRRLSGKKDAAIIGVVASGNLEVLLERVLPGAECEIDIATPITGYDETWKAVVAEFVERFSPGGLRISINDGGARPDTVFLRLMQGCALMEKE